MQQSQKPFSSRWKGLLDTRLMVVSLLVLRFGGGASCRTGTRRRWRTSVTCKPLPFSQHFTRLGRLAWMDEAESLIARLKVTPVVAAKCSGGSQAVKEKKPSSKQRRARRLAKEMDLDLDLHDEWADDGGVAAGGAALALTYGPQPADVAASSVQVVPARTTRKLEHKSSAERTPKRAATGPAADEAGFEAVQPAAVLEAAEIAEVGAVDSRLDFRGQKVLLEGMSSGRWTVVLQSGEKVRLKPDKLQPIEPSAQRWSHTLFSAK